MKIYAPNIHFFAFQLYKGANVEKSLTKQDIQLWHSANHIVHNTLKYDLQLTRRIVDISNEPKGSRVELIKLSEVKDGDYSINFAGDFQDNNQHQNQDILIKGFVYPIRIYDSYGLWLNLRRPEKEDDNTNTKDVDISLLSQFNPQNCLNLNQTDKKHKYFLGQTLLITGWITLEDKQNQTNPYNIAQECLTAIFPKPYNKPEFNRQGKLFDSPIFEYGLFSQVDNYQHVIIWLFDNPQPKEKFNQCYQELLDLFFFRSKVFKAFQDSRIIYQAIAAAYDEIENTIKEIKLITKSDQLTTKILNQLTDKLKDLPQKSLEYTFLLRNLKDYQNTIDINRNNYHEKLRQISAATQDDNLSILETFYKQDCERFDKQINADIGYFEQGSTLLEQATASIRTAPLLTQ
ncbi:hypothetical protein IQ247_24700 [Plectonema cf. radiosum LEGE 06105]|uniref:Uncharacterized protein n=1 Tax=Plectonema cf. radiosum LEGE 06105 TaxID=945769 RepID=A0A8J7F6A9_9CYAN|nr:hypothetical protein [Plectonema radiosum]MBE9215822.1 hypothetical protein [Plectonema cf. radiosum LEGE 06105]